MKGGQKLLFWFSIGGAMVFALVLGVGIYLEDFRKPPVVDTEECRLSGSGLLRSADGATARGRLVGWLPGSDRIEWTQLNVTDWIYARSRWLERDPLGQFQPVSAKSLICQPGAPLGCEGLLPPGKYEALDGEFTDGAGWMRMRSARGTHQVPVRWRSDDIRFGAVMGWCGDSLAEDSRFLPTRLIDGWSVWSWSAGLLTRFRVDARAPFHPQHVPLHADNAWSVSSGGLQSVACPAPPSQAVVDRVVARHDQVFLRALGKGWRAGETLHGWVWQRGAWRPVSLDVPWRGAIASWAIGRGGELLVETTDWWGRSPTVRIARREDRRLTVEWESPMSKAARWVEVESSSDRTWLRWPERRFEWGRQRKAQMLRRMPDGEHRLFEISVDRDLRVDSGKALLARERAAGEYLVLLNDEDDRVRVAKISCRR